MLNNAKEAPVDTATRHSAEMAHITTNMGASILRALPTGSRIQKAAHQARKDDFESFAASKPRTFSPNGRSFS